MKKLSIITALILVFGMFTLALAQTQVESGSWGTNSSVYQYSLDKNSGDRSMLIDVEFENPFDQKPDVMLGVTIYDGSGQTNTRYSVTPMSISRDGFTIKVATWADSKIITIGGYWIAHANKKMDSDN